MQSRKNFEPAILPSKGLNERRATLHVFSHTAPVTLSVDKKSVEMLGHFYKCTETDSVRLWGCEALVAPVSN